MTKAVFIAAAEPYSGKSLVLLGLVNMLLGQARRVGYFKPLVDYNPTQEPNPHLATLSSYFKLPLPPPIPTPTPAPRPCTCSKPAPKAS